MNFRIDPVDSKGVFDHDFYASDDYSKHVESLHKYLKLEGFDSITEEFHIKFNDHDWLCKPHKTKKSS